MSEANKELGASSEMHERFKEALFAYEMITEATVRMFNKHQIDLQQPKVVCSIIDAASQAMWCVMEHDEKRG